MEKLVIINGAYSQREMIRDDMIGWAWQLAKDVGIGDVDEFYVDNGINACVVCKTKREKCKFKGKDQFQEIKEALAAASMIMIGTQDYFGMPTPKIMALLGRFRCCPEIAEGKRVYIYVNGDYQSAGYAARALTSACEFVGFTVQERLIKINDR